MRKLMLVLLASAAPAFGAPGAGQFIDLDKPGALEALQAANPRHHATAMKFIRAASKLDCKEVKVREAAFEALMGPCAVGLFMASYPPKRQVQFMLGDNVYVTNVAIEDFRGQLMPADGGR